MIIVLPSASVPTATARTFAWSGAVLFVAALFYFLFAYAVTFGETVRRGSAAGPAAWDVALFSVFALHHSLFARDRFRAAIVGVAGAQLERSVYVWIASLLFIAVCAAWQYVPGILWHVEGIAAWPIIALQAFGIWLSAISAAIIDVLDLAGIRQLRQPSTPAARRQPAEFKTRGPYGLVRHPIYSGWFLIVFATPTMTMTRLVFAVTSAVYLLIAMPLEERSMRASTRGAYDRYARQVKWRLIPRVY
jgi:protein-S-isoprenylcysteine O-methyltransferase Ste14